MDQPARPEGDLFTNLIKSSTEMAPRGSRPYRFSRRNLPLIDQVENDPGPVLVPVLISPSIPILALVFGSSDELFKQFIKAYLESQGPSRPIAELKRSFMAKGLNVYYKRLHKDCYHFCQLCENHFETAGATGANRTLLAVYFLCGSISVH